MELKLDDIVLKPYRHEFAENLTLVAQNKKIAQNMRDAFPHPYNLQNAHDFIQMCLDQEKQSVFAIFYKGVFAGSVGLHPQKDVYRKSAELGYYVAEKYWNNGIASKSVSLIVKFGFESLHLTRIYAGVFQNNTASMRVLKNNGFVLEGIKRKAIFKNDKILDEHIYAILNE